MSGEQKNVLCTTIRAEEGRTNGFVDTLSCLSFIVIMSIEKTATVIEKKKEKKKER